MIIQTGNRTDIPAFCSEWFCNRIKEGFVLVRNPYNPSSVTRYALSPDVVDLIAFCTKNPQPMLRHMDLIAEYGQYWYVTITPYGRDIEPNVPDKSQVLDTNAAAVKDNMRYHDPSSPFLTGGTKPDDVIHYAVQKSWIDRQLTLQFD